MKRGGTLKPAWRAAPLPFEFHSALESGAWDTALEKYMSHPFYTPPADTYDLIRTILYKTKVNVDEVKQRFSEKVRATMGLRKRAPEEIEWGTFWSALNRGDSKTISMALSGARIQNVSPQIGIAEACAVLLRSFGKNWYTELVEQVPFSTVTRSNLVTVSLEKGRWDLACEILSWTKLSVGDVTNAWPLMAKFSWEPCLRLVTSCPKTAVPFSLAVPHLLKSGCPLATLAQIFEVTKVLGEVDVVAPLIDHAIEEENWDFVQRAMAHLADIGVVNEAALRAFEHLCNAHSIKTTTMALVSEGVKLHELQVSHIERLRFSKFFAASKKTEKSPGESI